MEGNIDKQDTGESKTDRGKERGMMRTYATQMEAARKGIVTPEMKAVAKKEYRSEEEIRELVNNGKATFYIGFDPTADSLHEGHFKAL